MLRAALNTHRSFSLFVHHPQNSPCPRRLFKSNSTQLARGRRSTHKSQMGQLPLSKLVIGDFSIAEGRFMGLKKVKK